MKRTVSVIALALVLVMCLGMMTSVVAETAEPAFARNEKGHPDLEGQKFDIWYLNRQPDTTNNLIEMEVFKRLQEMLNCELNLIHAPSGQEGEHFAITMAGDTLPDMFFCGSIDYFYPGGLAMAYADGLMFDYTEYIGEVHTPNFQRIFMEDEYLLPRVMDDQGRIIRMGAKIKGAEDCDFVYEGLAVRNDFLAQTGLDMPETIGDWYEMLTAFKANGVEYPLLMRNSYNVGFFANAYGIVWDDYYVGEDGKVHFGAYEDVYKDFLTEMNKWYDEGLINSDYMNLGGSDQEAILMNDRAGSVAMHYWGWNYGYYETVSSIDPSKAMTGAQLPKLNDEDELTNLRSSSRTFDDFKYITVDAKNPLACLYLLDALYCEDISNMMCYGIEGVAWDMVDGYPVTKKLADDQKLFGSVGEWHAADDHIRDYILTHKYHQDGVPAALQLVAQCGTDGRIDQRYLFYTEEEAQVRSDHSTDMQTYIQEMHLKFITGQTSLDEFDAYQEQLKALGIEELIEATQAAYDRFKART